jgi:hypothetical protein
MPEPRSAVATTALLESERGRPLGIFEFPRVSERLGAYRFYRIVSAAEGACPPGGGAGPGEDEDVG